VREREKERERKRERDRHIIIRLPREIAVNSSFWRDTFRHQLYVFIVVYC